MERNRKDRNGGVLDTVAELFDLPADLVAGLPHLEMMGSRQLYLERLNQALNLKREIKKSLIEMFIHMHFKMAYI